MRTSVITDQWRFYDDMMTTVQRTDWQWRQRWRHHALYCITRGDVRLLCTRNGYLWRHTLTMHIPRNKPVQAWCDVRECGKRHAAVPDKVHCTSFCPAALAGTQA